MFKKLFVFVVLGATLMGCTPRSGGNIATQVSDGVNGTLAAARQPTLTPVDPDQIVGQSIQATLNAIAMTPTIPYRQTDVARRVNDALATLGLPPLTPVPYDYGVCLDARATMMTQSKPMPPCKKPTPADQ